MERAGAAGQHWVSRGGEGERSLRCCCCCRRRQERRGAGPDTPADGERTPPPSPAPLHSSSGPSLPSPPRAAPPPASRSATPPWPLGPAAPPGHGPGAGPGARVGQAPLGQGCGCYCWLGDSCPWADVITRPRGSVEAKRRFLPWAPAQQPGRHRTWGWASLTPSALWQARWGPATEAFWGPWGVALVSHVHALGHPLVQVGPARGCVTTFFPAKAASSRWSTYPALGRSQRSCPECLQIAAARGWLPPFLVTRCRVLLTRSQS